jgi:hypothetical protein
MYLTRPLGIAALIIGLVSLGFAYHLSQAPLEQISNTLTGRYTDDTMWYIIAGAAAVIGGGLLTAMGKNA